MEVRVGDKGKGKDQGKTKKMVKLRKTGLRPHEQRQRDTTFKAADSGSKSGGGA